MLLLAPSLPTMRYWVPGGTGNTNSTTNWSLTSGGSSGAAVPIAGVDAIFDSNSGNGTVTVNAAFACKDFDSTSFTGTIAGSSAINCGGSFTLGLGITRTFTSAITMSSTTTGKGFTVNGKTLGGGVTFNGVGGGWTLQDNLTTTSTITITNGTFNTNDKAVGCSSISVTGSGALNIGTSSITSTSSINFGGGTTTAGAATLTYATSFTGKGGINLSSATINGTTSNTLPFSGATGTYGAVNLILTAATVFDFSGTNSFTSLSITSTNYATVAFASDQTVSGAFVATGGNNSTQRLFFSSSIPTITRTITCGSSNANSNVDLQDITVSGTTFTGTSIGDCTRNTGVTFDVARTCYWKHGGTASVDWTTANWYTTSGGATPTNMPLPQDTAICDANSFSATGKTITNSIAAVAIARLPAWNWTGVTNSPALSMSTFSYRNYGSFTWSASATYSGSAAPYFAGNRTMTITSAGQSWSSFNIDCFGGKVTSMDALSPTAITLRSGEFDDGSFSVTATLGFSTFSSGLINTLTMGTGNTWTFSNGSFSLSTPATTTVNSGTATIKFTSSSGTKNFDGGGKTYYNIENAMTSTGILAVISSSTLNNFKSAVARTNKFTAGTTTTLTGATPMTATGTAGNVITFASSSPGTQYTISSANNITTDYITISDCIFTSGGTWHAGANSTDGGNNTGITFP